MSGERRRQPMGLVLQRAEPVGMTGPRGVSVYVWSVLAGSMGFGKGVRSVVSCLVHCAMVTGVDEWMG